MKRSLALAVLVVLALVPGVEAAGGAVILHQRLFGSGAMADFLFQDGDVTTAVNVVVSLQRLIEPPAAGGGQFTPSATVTISQLSLTNGTVTLLAVGQTADFAFTIGTHLASASLQATVAMDDFVSGTEFNAALDLTWTATGPLLKEHTHERLKDAGMLFLARFKGDHRAATAAGMVQALHTNFTPAPTTDAEIQTNQAGTLILQLQQ